MKEAGITFKFREYRSNRSQLAFDDDVPIDRVSRSMRNAMTQTMARYYCHAKADPAFGNVNET
jgi:hypothetical protein